MGVRSKPARHAQWQITLKITRFFARKVPIYLAIVQNSAVPSWTLRLVPSSIARSETCLAQREVSPGDRIVSLPQHFPRHERLACQDLLRHPMLCQN